MIFKFKKKTLNLFRKHLGKPLKKPNKKHISVNFNNQQHNYFISLRSTEKA